MTRILALVSVALLAACGADGEPVTPTMNTNVGISSHSGVSVGTSVGVKKGPVSVGVGLGL
ncbi:MAG: hypothetical protein AAF280_08880 [Pseudomonadota bacterium]